MGLFAQQPEDPTEWAGLPSEPERRRGEAELLRDPPVGDALVGDAGVGTAWISIPVEPAPTGESEGKAGATTER